MKLILDMEPSKMGTGMMVAFDTIRENPDQEVGLGGVINTRRAGSNYEVRRNQDSYTVRVVDLTEDGVLTDEVFVQEEQQGGSVDFS